MTMRTGELATRKTLMEVTHAMMRSSNNIGSLFSFLSFISPKSLSMNEWAVVPTQCSRPISFIVFRAVHCRFVYLHSYLLSSSSTADLRCPKCSHPQLLVFYIGTHRRLLSSIPSFLPLGGFGLVDQLNRAQKSKPTGANKKNLRG